MTEPPQPSRRPTDGCTAAALRCPTCGAEVAAERRFCEACGTALTPTAAPRRGHAGRLEAPIELQPLDPRPDRADVEDTTPIARPCAECGGAVGADGYCETCGTKAPSERDHYAEQPAPWVAAVCDRGVRHHRNEDAIGARGRRRARAPRRAGGLRRRVLLARLRRGQPGGGPGGPRRAGAPASRPASAPPATGRRAIAARARAAAAARPTPR